MSHDSQQISQISVHQHSHCCSDKSCGKCDCCKAHKPKPVLPAWWIRLYLILKLVFRVILVGGGFALTVTIAAKFIFPLQLQQGVQPPWCPDEPVASWWPPGGVDPKSPFASSEGGATETLASWPKRSPESSPAGAHLDPGFLSRATELAVSEADGSPVAAPLRSGLGLTVEEEKAEPYEFWNENDKDGVLGFYRLGLTFLGRDAIHIAKAASTGKRPYVPFCSRSKFVPFRSLQFSYTYLEMVSSCTAADGRPSTQNWKDAMRTAYPGHDVEFDGWQANAHFYFEALMRKHELDPKLDDDHESFCLGVLSSFNRCAATTKSRQALKVGDAAYSVDQFEKARACWRRSIELAKESPDGKPAIDPDGAVAAILAQKRLQTHDTTCKWSPDSIAAISRDYAARSGDLIHVRVLQQALKALGHYDGALDGELSQATRAAIRKYQREREEDELGTLSTEQTVTLICNAAEGAGDAEAQTALGIMYVTGLGVDRNMDRALYWLNLASSQGHYGDATYNLAIVHGTGIVLGSYHLCDVPRSPEQAERYLYEAAAQGHPIAKSLISIYGPGSRYASLDPAARWGLIAAQQLARSSADTTGLYANRIKPIGAKCL